MVQAVSLSEVLRSMDISDAEETVAVRGRDVATEEVKSGLRGTGKEEESDTRAVPGRGEDGAGEGVGGDEVGGDDQKVEQQRKVEVERDGAGGGVSDDITETAESRMDGQVEGQAEPVHKEIDSTDDTGTRPRERGGSQDQSSVTEAEKE